MTRVRWVNGNQIGYGSGGWYRFVLDVETQTDYISVWWGVETNLAISDGTNSGDTAVNSAVGPFSNINFSHGSGGGVTWIRGEGFNVGPQQTISFSGSVRNLADSSGGGGTSSVAASWTNPRSAAGPPNQMGAPVVSAVTSTTMAAQFSAPATNGAGITGYHVQWHYAEGGLYYETTVPGAPVFGTGLTPNRQYAIRVRANSSAGPSPWSNFTYWYQAVAAPAAPSAPAVTRNSDTSHSLTWTRNATTPAPYSSQEVLRATAVDGGWGPAAVIAVLSGSATSYVDTTTIVNRRYAYHVRASNASGTAVSLRSEYVWTSPNPPADQAAAKDAASNIVVTWSAPGSAPSAPDLKYEVSESTDGGATWTLKTTTSPGVLTWTHSAPSVVLPHRYRIRAIVSPTGQVGSGLASAWAETNTVQLLTPPAAPTNLQSTPAGTVNRAQSITLAWQHNPLDSSPQTAYTLQHRAVGSGTWTTVGPVSTAVSSYTLPANAYATAQAFEWRVLTYGLHVDPSPYSGVSTVQISSAPSVNIATPAAAAVLGSTVLTVTWAYTDPDGDPQGSWEATLLREGVTVESRAGADTATSTTFEHRLQETAYTVRVRVRDSRGLWSTLDSRDFTVSYPLPPEPVITHSLWDWKRGTVELTFNVPAPTSGQIVPSYLEVWRSIDDGPLVRLVTDLPPLTVSYLDFTPTVEGKNTYVIQAISDLPSGAQSDPDSLYATVVTPQVNDGRPAVWLSGGPGFTRVGRLATEVAVEAGRIRERVLQRYAGRPLPVEHSGEHVDEVWSISGALNTRWSKDIDVLTAPEDWISLGSLAGPFLLRAPSLFGGPALYVYVSVEGPRVSRVVGGNVQQVSFTATRTEED